MKPNTIVQFWNTPELPEDISRLVATWKELNPSMKHKLFSYDSALQFIREHYDTEIQNLFEIAALPAMQSDIFRVAYCLKMGGFYIDCGTRCIASIEPLLSSESLFLVRKWHGGIWNGAIGCCAGHPALASIWSRIVQNLRERNSNDVWKLTGPLSFNQMVDSKEFESSINVVEQSATKPFFDIVNELEHKKRHWSKEQEKRSVFKSKPQSKAPNRVASSIAAFDNVSTIDKETCEVVISGGFEREDVRRLVVNISGVVLSSSICPQFPLIVNERCNRVEVEFYPEKVNCHFPLKQFISSGNNGVSDYMLLMTEQLESNMFYRLSLSDQDDLITILIELHRSLSKSQYSYSRDINVGSIDHWCNSIEKLIKGFSACKTGVTGTKSAKKSQIITGVTLELDTTKSLNHNELALCGEAILSGISEKQSFTMLLVADSKVSEVSSILVSNPTLLRHKAEFLQAVANVLHKTNLNGKKIDCSLERWFYAIQNYEV